MDDLCKSKAHGSLPFKMLTYTRRSGPEAAGVTQEAGMRTFFEVSGPASMRQSLLILAAFVNSRRE